MTSDKPDILQLLHALNACVMGQLDRKLRTKRLSLGSFMILQLVSEREKRHKPGPTRADVARHLRSTPASVSVMVKGMIERDWIYESWKNEQSQRLVLDEAGRIALKEGLRIWNAEHRELEKILTEDMGIGIARAANKVKAVHEHREKAKQLKKVTDSFRAKDKMTKEWRAKAKKHEERFKEEAEARERALDVL